MKKPDIHLHTSLAGFYKLEAVNAKTGKTRLLADWFPNLITDSGLEDFAVGGYLGQCSVGSGNAAPANGNTTLQTLVASTTNIVVSNGSVQGGAPYYGARTNTYQFAAGAAAGNLAEVGIGPVVGNLFSRALILDGGGSPTTITVLSDEFLNVTYQLRLYPPLADVVGSRTITGVATAYTLRASGVTGGQWAPGSNGDPAGPYACNVYDGAIGAITGSPSGSSDGAIFPAPSYSAGSHLIDSVATFTLGQANFATGISAAQVFFGYGTSSLGSVQCSYTPAINKDATKVTTLTFRHSWSRHPLP